MVLQYDQIATDDLVAEGDRVAKRYSVRATHGGDFIAAPATVNPVNFIGVTIYRQYDGTFAKSWRMRQP